MAWWMWMILGIALAVAEAMIPTNFYLLAFGIGGMVVGALAALGFIGAPWLEWMVFTLTAVGAIVFFQRTLARDDDQRVVDDLTRETAVVIEDVPAGGVGRAELRGSTWSARSSGAAIPRGTRCRVERVDGLTLWLQPE
jgi:hypothetical protein